jgi:hypothetical protein
LQECYCDQSEALYTVVYLDLLAYKY